MSRALHVFSSTSYVFRCIRKKALVSDAPVSSREKCISVCRHRKCAFFCREAHYHTTEVLISQLLIHSSEFVSAGYLPTEEHL